MMRRWGKPVIAAHLWALALLLGGVAVADTTSTAATYSNTNGSLSSATVINQSTDGKTATPVNAATPLPSRQTPYSSSLVTNISPTNVGITSAVVDAAQTRRSYLMIQNPSPLGGPYFSCNFGPTAVLGGSGTVIFYPTQGFTWEGTAVPNAQIACIASAAATQITIYALEQ